MAIMVKNPFSDKTVKDILLLREAFSKGILDFGEVTSKLKELKEKEYLESHDKKVWQGKNGSWYTYLNYDGKRKLIKKSTKALIENEIIEYYRKLDPETNPTFKDDFFGWIEEKKRFGEVKESSILRYMDDYNRFLKGSEFEMMEVRAIDDLVLDEFVRSVIFDYNLSSKAYSCFRTIVCGALKYSKRHHHTDFSPTIFFRDLQISKNSFKKPSSKRKDVYTKNERKLLYDYLMANKSIENLGLALMCLTGLRVGELASLKKEDNVSDSHLYIHRTETRRLNDTGLVRMAVGDTAKMDHDEVIVIPKAAQRVIDLANDISRKDEYLFSKNGRRITARSFRYHLKKACKEIDIPYRPPHQMRKTYASILLASGTDEAIVKREMRHTQISTTRAYYQYITETDDDEKAIIDSVMGL